MSSISAAVLKAAEGQKLALEGVEVEANLSGLLAEATLTQTYRNLEESNIEAVYTFPLPLDAVLLELVLEIGDRRLKGVVQEKAQAATRYEEAIEGGDAAVLLEKAGPGLYSVNVGNLQPGETAVIRFRYAQLLYWQGETLRYHLPTTLAPRYGDPASAGLDPHQEPEYTLHADHGFSLLVKIDGTLAGAVFDCPSHPIVVSGTDEHRELSLSGGHVQMDRDFVLVLREPEGGHSEALIAPQADGFVALATFHPRLPAPQEAEARCIKLVVDCSGSMLGDSIAQARIALTRIVEELSPRDHFNIVAFGSDLKLLFPRAVIADENSVRAARAFIDQLDANMGGTEMKRALDAAFQSPHTPEMAADVLLITDGEVWDDGALIATARVSSHRVFTIGVGSSVAESTVRELAQSTGGACELVAPREDMAERVVRHFRRIDQPAATDLRVDWGCEPNSQTPESIQAFYVGDTLHVFAWLPTTSSAPISLLANLNDGSEFRQCVVAKDVAESSSQSEILPRIAAWRLLSEQTNEQALESAVKYQLVTDQTSCVLIDERSDNNKATSMPQLQKMSHVVPAGWSGTGVVAIMSCSMGYFSEPRFLRHSSRALDASKLLQRNSIQLLIKNLNHVFARSDLSDRDIKYFDDLDRLGLDERLSEKLRALVDQGHSEKDVVWGFLKTLYWLQNRESIWQRSFLPTCMKGKRMSGRLRSDLVDLLSGF